MYYDHDASLKRRLYLGITVLPATHVLTIPAVTSHPQGFTALWLVLQSADGYLLIAVLLGWLTLTRSAAGRFCYIYLVFLVSFLSFFS